jgi:hypothetical protein
MAAKPRKQRAAEAPTGTVKVPAVRPPSFLERHAAVMAIALVALATLRIAATYTVFNHTFDEEIHLACGMQWLDAGRYDISPEHPPLARAAMAVGPYLLGARSQDTPQNIAFPAIVEGLKILYSGDHYDSLLAAARAGILPFFWLACAVVYWWGARYFGRAEAVAALFLFTFLEPVLAHAGVATTDMPLTACLGAAFLCAVRWIEDPTYGRAAIFGLCAGLAIVSKYSSLVFFPAAAVVALLWYAARLRPKADEVRAAAMRLLPGLAVASAVVALVIFTTFRFSFAEFFRGIGDLAKHNSGGHPGYLLGQRSQNGFWLFYPAVLAVKTPLAFLFLLGVGAVAVCRRNSAYRLGWLPLAYAAGILGAAVFSHINIGVRHILPVYTGFALAAGAGAVHLWRMAPQRPWGRYALAAAMVWFGATSLAAHPDYLPYFNELAGANPENILVDSDLDWGQDYKRLAVRLRELGAREVSFQPFATADLERKHGFPPVAPLNPLSPNYGWNAVSVTMWKERRLGLNDSQPEANPLWPDLFEPTEKVGKSIYLWYFPPPGSGGAPPRRR